MIEIDKVNMEILDQLQRDGRMSNAKLADHLRMSETPCWRRLKKLEESGVIESYQANLKPPQNRARRHGLCPAALL